MTQPAPPTVFSALRRLAVRRRALQLQTGPAAARYVLDDMAGDVIERLDFLRHSPVTALVIGDWTGAVAAQLIRRGTRVTARDPLDGFAEESPFPETGFDFIVSLGTLDTVNDLPGALIHIRSALAAGGLAIASFVGAGSLARLRSAMLAADGDRPAPRLHPAVDVRGAGQLLQRAGWADPVVDQRSLPVRYSGLSSLVSDLRAQGFSNMLARPGPALSRRQYIIAQQEFGVKTTEQFEILTLSGWRR